MKSLGTVFGRYTQSYDVGVTPIWQTVDETWLAGGTVVPTPADGEFIPAGTAIVIDEVGGDAKIYVDGVDDAADVKGLTKEDVYFYEGADSCTVTVVTKGSILADRMADNVTDDVKEVLRNGITFFYNR